MNAQIQSTNEPLGDVRVIADFLPSPAELAFHEEGVKVTLALSKKRRVFKSEAPKILPDTSARFVVRSMLTLSHTASSPETITNRSTDCCSSALTVFVSSPARLLPECRSVPALSPKARLPAMGLTKLLPIVLVVDQASPVRNRLGQPV